MKNKLPDLQNHLFELIERLNDQELNGDDLKQEIERAMAVNNIARTAVANGALMARCADTLYGIPISPDVPLIPMVEDQTYFKGKKALIPVPRQEGC